MSPTPQFILDLRATIGHAPLFLFGVTAIVLREHEGRQQVLLVQRSDTHEWTAVSGIVEPGQQVHEAALREVLEETCVVAEIVRLTWVKTYPMVTYVNGDQAEYINHTFLMRYVSGEATPGDDESVAAAWFDLDDLPPMQVGYVERLEQALRDEPGVLFGDLPGTRA
ncbi:NUDIX hydrolase [Aestuariimicrobium sp. Y1814]|uniref:NUDIX hydrolase n=1 Tax=Aestuariimicrobium sp. Y1814 TaxID=3418742 RepID=UPI003DA704B0